MNILEQYNHVAGSDIINELSQMASVLNGVKILHINSTKEGGGVAEILVKMVPLFNSLGVEATWEVISGNAEFYECTKQFHNGLQGLKESTMSAKLLKNYEEINSKNAAILKSKIENADVVFIHDPQPAALIEHFPNKKNKWIWRCHIDASNPNRFTWKYLNNFIKKYDANIFSLVDFVQPLSSPIYLIPPSIDPFTEKNREMTMDEINTLISPFGIDLERPYILQVSRFDYFKDPIGVIESYRMAKKFHKELQLVLAGGGASDDPEGEMMLKQVNAAKGNDPDIHILFLPSDSHAIINALQRKASIVLQKSIKEGFGLTVTEALWKNKPVIGGNTGGIRLQIINHHTGYLVNTPEGAAERIRYLLQKPDMIFEMGIKGHRFVRDNFLMTRQVRDYLTLIISLLYPSNKSLIEMDKIGKR